jgi:hypothetical protein
MRMRSDASPKTRLRLAAALALAICTGPTLARAAAPEPVSLTEQTVRWSTVKYATTDDNGFVDGSLDKTVIVDRAFRAQVLENRYLKVTLVPEFGGRILSIIYKPTGHEQLYRTEVGVPYGIKADNFYYDWLMVYGGIFPTFPDPEHGRTWLKPWDFRVVIQTPSEVTVAMSITDDFAYAAAPKRFTGETGIAATYYITLKADRAALDTRLVLQNTQSRSIAYEYWTCTTLAPGSDPDHPRTTAGAEIIAPVTTYVTPAWSANIAAGDARAGADTYRFEKLRWFRNWPSMGIAYAAPDMQGGNFWGVINHDNEEGIIRIADNRVTRGLKMWTWGFQSITGQADPREAPNEAQPYVELWGGVSDQFFHPARLPASSEVSIAETYSPTVGMSNVTQANENILINLAADRSAVRLQFFNIVPEEQLMVMLKRGDAVLFNDSVISDPKNGNRIVVPIPSAVNGEPVQLTIRRAGGEPLIAAETPVK